MTTIPTYPDTCALTLDLRSCLHERLRRLPEGVSEFTFANLYLFREKHRYRFTLLPDALPAVTGRDGDAPFFMLPFGLPDTELLARLFSDHACMKCVTENQKPMLENLGYAVLEDRDNFDYLYNRCDLAELKGRKFSKKRNLINAFINDHEYTGKPLLDEHIPEALAILEQWREEHGEEGDYAAAREALEQSWGMQLCGGIYHVDNRPAAYSLGEELAGGTCFVIHFEKALQGYKGLYQFINQSFAAILPDCYDFINREQDLGDAGLRQAKESYQPAGFVKKYRACKTT
ncbi:MAG: DUF2156 domain-containing protein [Deltaproteobacteria bacterium]|nr:DUF2156 domain-containing protein [Deltaproteobacteria bacterium]